MLCVCCVASTGKAASFVYNPISVTKVTLPQDNPPRSLWVLADFFHSSLFVIRCQQNFLGAQTMPFMWEVSHGLIVSSRPFKHHAKRLQSKVHMSFCSLVAQAWIHIYPALLSSILHFLLATGDGIFFFFSKHHKVQTQSQSYKVQFSHAVTM